MRLIRSELMKIRTTNVWWLFAIGVFVFTALSLLIWIMVADGQIDQAIQSRGQAFEPPPPDVGIPQAEIDEMRRQWEIQNDLGRLLRTSAANIYTSGQFFGLMFVMLLGAILVTNEFFHQTATSTFLTTPQRTKVILAKLATACLAAAVFWIFTTGINVATGAIYFSNKGYASQLGDWPVTRAILMNGLAFGLWGILGVGLGVLIRNQIGAVLVGAIAYVIGSQAVQLVFVLIHEFWIKKDWVLQAMVAFPTVASQVMISPEKTFAQSPVWWVGALVLVGYGVLFGTVGTLITRKRDIS